MSTNDDASFHCDNCADLRARLAEAERELAGGIADEHERGYKRGVAETEHRLARAVAALREGSRHVRHIEALLLAGDAGCDEDVAAGLHEAANDITAALAEVGEVG